jgi:carbonic anhydrase/acetyltransferase-like protein (isoleucine patch superfamily)
MARKYKLLREKVKITRVLDGKPVVFDKLYRIQALRDIPRHGVKAGDLGGYVRNRKILRQTGDCWIAKDAIVDYSSIYDNVLITDQAVLYSTNAGGNAVVSDHAYIYDSRISGEIVVKDNAVIKDSAIYGKVIIDKNSTILDSRIKSDDTVATVTDEVFIHSSTILGRFLASGEVRIITAHISGDTEVSGKSQILADADISGHNRISGESFVPPSFKMANVILHNQVAEYALVFKNNLASGIQRPTITATASPETESYIESIKELEDEYNSYVTDIVKLIKYPAMADLSVPETQSLTIALRAAKRAVKSLDLERLKQAHENLEKAFVVAENRAHILVQSHLDETKKASLLKADQLFAIACNDVSSETEKKASFKKGIQNLAGVIPVSEEAISVFKARAGLLEIEA